MTTKGEQTKQKILKVAMELFSKKSFTSVTIRDVAKAAGVSPSLIYKYFEDQERLYFEAMQVASEELIIYLSDSLTLDSFVQNYIDYMFKTEVLYEMMAYFMLEASRPHAKFPIMSEISSVMNLLEKKTPLPNAKQETQLLFSTLNGLLITYKNLPNYAPNEALAHIQDLAQHYINRLKINFDSE